MDIHHNPHEDSPSEETSSLTSDILMKYPSFNNPYISGRGRARFVIVCLWLTIAVRILCMANAIITIHIMYQAAAGVEYTDNDTALIDMSANVLNGLVLAVQLSTAIAFLMWIYRAYGNLPALGARDLEYSPGWAVGYFFIPILCLFRPYQVMSEIWRWSDATAFSSSISHYLRSSSSLVAYWWGLFLGMNIFSHLSNSFLRHAKTNEEYLSSCYFSAFVYLLISVAAAITTKLVRTIEENQQERHALVLKQSADANVSSSPSYA